MARLIQRGDPEVASLRLTGSPRVWPDAAMTDGLDKTCDECGSFYRGSTSLMEALCPECAHQLYDYPACAHRMVAGRCETCGWDGSVSAYVASLKAADPDAT